MLAAKTYPQKSHRNSQSDLPPAESSAEAFLGNSPYQWDMYDLDTTLTAFQWYVTHCGLGAADSTQRVSFSSIVHQQTGSFFDLDLFLCQVVQSLREQYAQGPSKSTVPQWPPVDLIRRCISHYDASGFYSFFPVADTEALRACLDEIVNKPKSPAPAANRACLAAFTALITELHRLEPKFADAAPDNYLQAVLATLPQLLIEDATVRTLETIVILVSLYIRFPLVLILTFQDGLSVPLGTSPSNKLAPGSGDSYPFHTRGQPRIRLPEAARKTSALSILALLSFRQRPVHPL